MWNSSFGELNNLLADWSKFSEVDHHCLVFPFIQNSFFTYSYTFIIKYTQDCPVLDIFFTVENVFLLQYKSGK